MIKKSHELTGFENLVTFSKGWAHYDKFPGRIIRMSKNKMIYLVTSVSQRPQRKRC